MNQLQSLEARFPLHDHEQRKGSGQKMLTYVSTEAINARLNAVFGFDWETKETGHYLTILEDGKFAASSHVEMVIWLDSATRVFRVRSGAGAAVGTDLDMVVKTALVEARKKAFYEFGGCRYLWNDHNTSRISKAFNGQWDSIRDDLVESSGKATAADVAKHYDVSVKDMLDESVLLKLYIPELPTV